MNREGEMKSSNRVMRNQSLTYFAENYLRIKDNDGNKRKLDGASMEILKMTKEAQKRGGHLELVQTRTGYRLIIVKD